MNSQAASASVVTETCPSPSQLPDLEKPETRNPEPETDCDTPIAFPITQLPPLLRDFSTSVAAASPISIDYAATTCLAVLSAAIGAGAVHHHGETRIRPNLFFLTVTPDTSDRTTCHRLAYAPLEQAQARLDQALGPERQPEIIAQRRHLQGEWHRIAHNPKLTLDERDAQLFENNVAQERLELEAKADLHLLLTQIPRGQLLPHLTSRLGQSVALFNPDATRPAQILTGRYKADALEEQTYLAAHAGTQISSAERFNLLRTVPDPCLTLHWALTPEACDRILASKKTAHSPLLPHFIYLKTDTCPRSLLSQYTDPQPGEAAQSGLGVPPMSPTQPGEAATQQSEIPSDLSRSQKPTILNPKSAISSIPPIVPAALKSRWSNLINTLLHHRADSTPIEYPITEAAATLLHDFETETREAIRNSPYPTQTAFLAHHPTLARRLALLLHCTDQASLAQRDPEPAAGPEPVERVEGHTTEEAAQESAIGVPPVPASPSTQTPPFTTHIPSPISNRSEFSDQPSRSKSAHAPEVAEIRNPQSEIRNAAPPISASTAAAAIALTRFYCDQHRQLAGALKTITDQTLLLRLKNILEDRDDRKITLGQLKDRHDINARQVEPLAAKYPEILHLGKAPKPLRGPDYRILTLVKNYYGDTPSSTRTTPSAPSQSNRSEFSDPPESDTAPAPWRAPAKPTDLPAVPRAASTQPPPSNNPAQTPNSNRSEFSDHPSESQCASALEGAEIRNPQSEIRDAPDLSPEQNLAELLEIQRDIEGDIQVARHRNEDLTHLFEMQHNLAAEIGAAHQALAANQTHATSNKSE